MAGWNAVKRGMDESNLAILVGIRVESLVQPLQRKSAALSFTRRILGLCGSSSIDALYSFRWIS